MPPFDKGVNECSTGQWEAYRKANEIFTEAILSVYEDDDYAAGLDSRCERLVRLQDVYRLIQIRDL